MQKEKFVTVNGPMEKESNGFKKMNSKFNKQHAKINLQHNFDD